MKPTAESYSDQNERQASAAPFSGAKNADERRILLAEDSEDIQRLIAACLEHTPHQLSIVADGQAAVETFCSGPFDLVLMDVQMPVMDGYTAARKIRQWEAQRAIRPAIILALTGGVLEEDESACDACLSKPIQMDTLLVEIEKHLDARGRGRPPRAEGIEGLIPKYLKDRKQEVHRLIAALERSDYETIRVLGHNLKGSGDPYGFAALTAIGRSLELAAKAESPAEIQLQIAALSEYLAGADAVL